MAPKYRKEIMMTLKKTMVICLVLFMLVAIGFSTPNATAYQTYTCDGQDMGDECGVGELCDFNFEACENCQDCEH